MAAPNDFVYDPRFDKIFVLPADPLSGRITPFQIQYADYGYRNENQPEEEIVFLFFGSLLGSRLAHIAKDKLAKEHNIRIINPDRPGIGGTDIVKQKDLISLWRFVILALLRHLEIKHVCIGCHSGGTILALDMLLHHPEILYPDNRGYIAIGSPWILPSHTGSKLMSIAKALPASVIGKADQLARIINNHLGPMIGLSLGMIYLLIGILKPTPRLTNIENTGMREDVREDVKFEEDLWPYIIERIYAGNVKGISNDAILFLQSGYYKSNGWGDWDDYDKLVPCLEQAVRASGRRLRVNVFYAEDDSLIGNAGSRGSIWFDQCWQLQYDNIINYESTAVAGADHDGIWSLRQNAVQTVFHRISQLGS